jgi:peptidoglycan/LPS O-acetylase OafA/YrhL
VTGGWHVGLVAILYLAYPALAWLREKLGLPFLAALALGLWTWSLPSTLHLVMAQTGFDRFHAYVLAPNQVFLLAWGGLLGVLHADSARRLDIRWALLLALPLVWILVKPTPQFFDHLVVLTGWIRYRYALVVTGLVALAAFARNLEAAPGSRPVAWLVAGLAKLGDWSYGLYLLHPFTQHLVAPRLGGLWGMLLALLLAILAAAAVHRWIETPLARLGRS